MRVLIVDDHPLLREGVTRALERHDDLTIDAAVGTGAEALERLEQERPDVLLLDITLPDVDGVDLLGRVQERHPDLPVLVFTMHDDAQLMRTILEAGARGFVTKDEPTETLVHALRRVHAGHTYVGEAMLDALTGMVSGEPSPPRHPAGGDGRPGRGGLAAALTDREHDVMTLMGQGFKPAQIAKRLGVSPRTVSSHRENMKKKLGLDSVAELERLAIAWTHEQGSVTT